MARDTQPPAEVLAMLAAAPERLAEVTAGLSAAQLRAAPAPGEWSAVEVLAHLRACGDMWGGAIARLVAEDRPTIKAMSPLTWIEQTDYGTLDFKPSWRAYTQQRAELLALLRPLAAAGWRRWATVTGAGKPLKLTVLDYGRRLAVHERPHLKQIARLAAALLDHA